MQLELPRVAWFSPLCPVLLIASVEVAYADVARFCVESERLIYNTNIPYPDDPSTGINNRDAAEMGLYLMEAPEISIIVLESYGGEDARRYGWTDEFGQGAMMYDRGQSDMRWALLHLVQHGISLDFALKIFATPREDMWWPTREEMIAGVVLKIDP
jgi:hypothetical protein